MNVGAAIQIGYDQSISLLRKSELFLSFNTMRKFTFSSVKFSESFIKASLGVDYTDIYNVAMQNFDYDILLQDKSFLQFSYEFDAGHIKKIRYAYYETPIDVATYQDFLGMHGLTYSECGDEFIEDYQQLVDEAHLKRIVMPIRYDYDEEGYKGLEHPVSHIHIGHDNEIRIPFSRILTPKAFVAFIIRQIYWKKWKKNIQNTDFREEYLMSKELCVPVASDFFTTDDEQDFFIA